MLAGLSALLVLAVGSCADGEASAPSSPASSTAAEAQADALDPATALEPYALLYEEIDADLAAQAAAVDASVYLAAPLLTAGPQAVIELGGDLRPRAVVDASGASLAALSASDDALVGMSRACLAESGGYGFCSRIATLDAAGADVDVSTEDLDLDFHTVTLDADGGGFWADRYVPVTCEDGIGPCEVPTEDGPLERILDCDVVHVRDGEPVWEWSALDHLGEAMLEDATTTLVYNPDDPFHCNSIQPDDAGTTVYVSMRHLSSVMAIDVASGEVLWTFGENSTDEALEVADPDGLLGDRPVLSGQHDFRWLGGDRFSVFDNSSEGAGVARAVIFTVAGGTATVDAVIEDPQGRGSRCTGSARPLDAAETFWAVSWGCSESGVSVMTADGREVARVTVDFDAAVERDLLTDVAAEQPDLGHTVSYQAVVGPRGLLG